MRTALPTHSFQYATESEDGIVLAVIDADEVQTKILLNFADTTEIQTLISVLKEEHFRREFPEEPE